MKKVYIRGYIGEYYRGYYGEARSLDYSLYGYTMNTGFPNPKPQTFNHNVVFGVATKGSQHVSRIRAVQGLGCKSIGFKV